MHLCVNLTGRLKLLKWVRRCAAPRGIHNKWFSIVDANNSFLTVSRLSRIFRSHEACFPELTRRPNR